MALPFAGSKTSESTAALAVKAINKAEAALTDLMVVSDKTDEAINGVNAQIESLLAEKSALVNRRNDLEGYISGMVAALYPVPTDEFGRLAQEFDADEKEPKGELDA